MFVGITFVFPPKRAFCGMTFMLCANSFIMEMLLPRPCIKTFRKSRFFYGNFLGLHLFLLVFECTECVSCITVDFPSLLLA